MGKLKIIILITLFFELTACNKTSLTYSDIYRKYGEEKLFEELCRKNSVENDNKLKVKVIVDVKSPVNGYYIFFKNKIIKAPFNINNCNNLEWEESIKCLINIDNFNEYINYNNIKSNQDVFLFFLSYYNNYRVVKSHNDLQKIIKDFPVNKGRNNINDFLILTDFEKLKKELMRIKSNEIICWFQDFGVIKLIFKNKNDNLIKEVDSYFMGYLGNENVIW